MLKNDAKIAHFIECQTNKRKDQGFVKSGKIIYNRRF